MITTKQFEHRLLEYLDGELSDAEKREVEEYLQAHPEAIGLEGDFSLLCAAGKSIRESTFSADLLLEANRKLSARLTDPRHKDVSTPVASDNESLEIAPNRTRRRLRPPVLSAVFAALAILIVGVVTQRAALADIASSLLQRIVVTFNDEPLSDSQQQAFDELVEITETLDENGDQVVTVNITPENLTTNQLLQELADGGVLEVNSDSGNIMWLKGISGDVVNHDSLHTALDSLHAADGGVLKVFSGDVVNHDSLHTHTALDSLRAAKIGSQSPNVAEDQSWGDIKKAVGSTTDDSP